MLPSLAALGLLLAGCARPDDTGLAPVRSFRTNRCRARVLVDDVAPPAGEWGYTRWHPPAAAPVHLVEVEGEVSGEAPDNTRVLQTWDAAALAADWDHSEDQGEARWLSPVLSMGRAQLVRLRLRPGAARHVTVVASHKPDVDRRVRGLRSVRYTLDQGDADREITLDLDLDTVLHENWGDDRAGSRRLRRLEIAVPEDQAGGFSLASVEVLPPDAAWPAAAGRTLGDVGGRLHPSWYVRAGSEVRLRVRVPEAGADLRWYGAAEHDTSTASITVRAGEQATGLGSWMERRDWVHHSAPLDAWAGQEVELVLGNQGKQVLLYGDPRVVVRDTRQPDVPSVVVVLADTLRADHLGAWGSPVADVSPRLDALAAEGVMFSGAISSSAWTKPAIPTLLTGLWATTHQVGLRTYADKLPATVPAVQDAFRQGGWRTGSFSANALGSTMSGLERGFDAAMPPHHWRGRLGELGHPTTTQLGDAFLAWWAEEPDQPVFAYLHTVEPHAWRRAPYEDPPEGYRSYDATVKDLDTQVGAFVDRLQEQGLAEDLVLVFLSDHGESFGDHGVKAHGSGLWQSQVHIPLILWSPGDLPPMRSQQVVGLADITPTVVDLAGLPPVPGADGRSLVPALTGARVHEAVPSARVRYVWEPKAPVMHALVRQDKLKAIRIGEDDEQVFDLTEDLCEKRTAGVRGHDLFEALDAHLAEEEAEAAAFREAHGVGAAEAVDAEHVEMLREMGYLD